MSTATASSFLNAAGTIGRVTISQRVEAGQRDRRVLARVSRAGWRLEQAERERVWALIPALSSAGKQNASSSKREDPAAHAAMADGA